MVVKNNDGTWTMGDAEYQEFISDSRILTSLYAAGVENWEGYGYVLCDEDDEEWS